MFICGILDKKCFPFIHFIFLVILLMALLMNLFMDEL